MGDPSGCFWNSYSDADMGSIYCFLDIQCMCGNRTSSFLWEFIGDAGNGTDFSDEFSPET